MPASGVIRARVQFRAAAVVAATLLLPFTARAGELEDRAIEVRAFIDGVIGGIETLQIPEDIHDLPQPTLPNGNLDPEYVITEAKAELGKFLFHDPLFSAASGFEETVLTASCASCHFAEAGFRAGQLQSLGVGARGFVNASGQAHRQAIPSLAAIDNLPTPFDIHDAVDNPPLTSPSINMVAFFEALQWSGSAFQFGPGELPAVERQIRTAFEHHRLSDAAIVGEPAYRPLFEAAYPELAGEPDPILINLFTIFKAIGAYERTVVSNQSRWDDFLAGDNSAMTFAELDGAELFFGDANCYACHSGPALGSATYHALGVAEHPGLPEGEDNLGRFDVTGDPADMHKFRAMTVRNNRGFGPFFHGGSAATLEDVIRYKNAAIPERDVPTLSPLFVPLNLTEQEIQDLLAFVADALEDPNMDRYSPQSLPSGLCVPHDDQASRYDAGCDQYGDFDFDGDVDLADFGRFQVCFGGDANVTDGPCYVEDRDGDEVVDLTDYAAFVASATE